MNDLQSAFALSRSEYKTGCQAKEVERLRAEGKWLYIEDGLIHCRFTDAVIASETHIISVHDTEEQANEAMGEQFCSELYVVGPTPPPPIPMFVPEDQEAPF